MTTWGLIIETTVGVGERKHTEAYVVAHIIGPRVCKHFFGLHRGELKWLQA
ncbi:hypothetical protein ACWEQ7_10775 [Streptomyces sp. NPDC004069]